MSGIFHFEVAHKMTFEFCNAYDIISTNDHIVNVQSEIVHPRDVCRIKENDYSDFDRNVY